MAFAVYPTVANEVARYLEDGTLNDSLGAAPVLQVLAGRARRSDILPGVQGLAFDEASRIGPVAYAPFRITGAVTVECIFRAHERTTNADQWTLVTHEYTGDSGGANALWGLKIFQNYTGTGGAPVSTPGWLHEHSSGSDAILVDPTSVIEPGGVYHVVGRRGAPSGGNQTVDLWLNGVQVATGSLTQASSGATSTLLRIGCNPDAAAGSYASGTIGFVRICSRALSDAEIEAAYAATLGGVLGARRVSAL